MNDPRQSHQWKKLREGWAAHVAAGTAICRRCGEPITPGAEWDLGHDRDGDGRRPLTPEVVAKLAPEHRSCNRTAGARLAGRIAAGVDERAWAADRTVWAPSGVLW